MMIIKLEELKEKKRVVNCPFGDFVSNRFLLEQDGMGFTFTKTIIPKNNKTNFWHYKNHLEACYCISGNATLINLENDEKHKITKDVLYVLNNNEKHRLITHEDTVLLCVFNPPLKGNEVHNKDGVYVSGGEKNGK